MLTAAPFPPQVMLFIYCMKLKWNDNDKYDLYVGGHWDCVLVSTGGGKYLLESSMRCLFPKQSDISS